MLALGLELDHDVASVAMPSFWSFAPMGDEHLASWDVVKRFLWGIFGLHLLMKGSKSCPPLRAFLNLMLTLWILKLAAMTAFLFDEDWLAETPWHQDSGESTDGEQDDASANHACCPKRRARFWKCFKRRERRRRRAAARAEAMLNRFCPLESGKCGAVAPDKVAPEIEEEEQDDEDGCYFQRKPCRFAVAFCKTLNLPPPLPFAVRRRGRRGRCSDGHHHVEDPPSVEEHGAQEESSVSEGSTSSDNHCDLDSSCNKSISEDKVSSHQEVVLSPVASPPNATRCTSHLIDMVRMQQWQLLLDHPQCISRRQAKYRDADGLYPLHWAVAGGAPTALVQTLAETYPSAVRRSDKEGSTPLHFATHYGSKAVLYLVQLYPDAAHQLDTYGRSPLFHAVSTQPLSVLMVLVRTAPAMVTTPCYSPEDRKRRQSQQRQQSRKHRPLVLPDDRQSGVTDKPDQVGRGDADEQALVVSREDSMRTPLFRMWSDVLSDPVTRSQLRGKTWDKAIWLLLAAYEQLVTGQVSQELQADGRQALYTSIVMDVYLPERVVSMLISAYPEQLRHVNALGQLPLAVAIAPSRPGSSNLDAWSKRRSEVLVRELLRAFVAAAHHINATTGRSTLMEAIVAGHLWTEGLTDSSFSSENDQGSILQQLVDAAPDLLQARDGETGLPPALLAAAVAVARNATGAIERSDAGMDGMASSGRLVDPYGLLSKKQRELIQVVATPAATDAKARNDQTMTLDTSTLDTPRTDDADQLATIFSLLRANPAQLAA